MMLRIRSVSLLCVDCWNHLEPAVAFGGVISYVILELLLSLLFHKVSAKSQQQDERACTHLTMKLHNALTSCTHSGLVHLSLQNYSLHAPILIRPHAIRAFTKDTVGTPPGQLIRIPIQTVVVTRAAVGVAPFQHLLETPNTSSPIRAIVPRAAVGTAPLQRLQVPAVSSALTDCFVSWTAVFTAPLQYLQVSFASGFRTGVLVPFAAVCAAPS